MIVNKHHFCRYGNLIKHYRNNPQEGFCEKHHIKPKCLGGTNDVDNLILVPTRVHFILHLLLHKSYPNNRSLSHAFAMMVVNNKFQNRKMNSKLYDMAKTARSKALTGIPRPEWVKKKLRVPKLNKENYKKPKSSEHANNISKSLKGKKKTEVHIKNMILSQRNFQEKRHNIMLVKIEKYRKLFIKSGLKRKDFYQKYNLNESTGKRYLRGL